MPYDELGNYVPEPGTYIDYSGSGGVLGGSITPQTPQGGVLYSLPDAGQVKTNGTNYNPSVLPEGSSFMDALKQFFGGFIGNAPDTMGLMPTTTAPNPQTGEPEFIQANEDGTYQAEKEIIAGTGITMTMLAIILLMSKRRR